MKPAHDPLSGDWQNLENGSQAPRYRAIAALIPAGSGVLDVGCGTAILARFLHEDCRYVGIEPSTVAVDLARRSETVFHASAEEFQTDSKVDCVVFNEMLYYSRDPIGLLRRYSNYLAPTGRLIVSIYQKPGRPSLRNWVACAMNRKRPRNNQHCSAMVDRFVRESGRRFSKHEVGPHHLWVIHA